MRIPVGICLNLHNMKNNEDFSQFSLMKSFFDMLFTFLILGLTDSVLETRVGLLLPKNLSK